MLARIAPLGLFTKFLLVLVPTFLALSFMGFSVLLSYDERATGEQLAARIGNQAARVSALLSRHVESADKATRKGLLSLLASDAAVTCAALREQGDDVPILAAPNSEACANRPVRHEFSLPVGNGDTSLTVSFSAAEILAANTVQHQTMFVVIMLMLAVSIASAALGFRFIIGARLASLRNAIRLITDTGERVPVATGGRDALGDILQAFNEMIARDEEREAALRRSNKAFHESQDELESEKRFRHFAASASDWYWEMDGELRFSYFSERFTEITGVTQEALLGKTRQETGIPDVEPGEWQQYLDDLANYRPFRNFTHPRITNTGRTVWLTISGTPFFTDDGQFMGYRGIGADITERVEIEHQLARAKEMKEVSEAAARAKSEFLATMSHEIRTPINGVLGTSDLLLRESLQPDHRYLVETIDRSGRALLDLVNDILDFSKIEAGRVDLEYAQFDLHQIIEEVAESAALAAHGKGLELACLIAPGVPMSVCGDASRLRQVLTNLVGNAVKFTETGYIAVDVAPASAADGSTTVRFEVRDTGIGIAAEAQAGIFDSFSQADLSTTRRFGGTGLGLAISSKLVGLMGAKIALHSAPGSGSQFSFAINLAEDPSVREVSANAPFPGLRALLVCEEIVGRSLCMQLVGLGVACTHTTSGRQTQRQLFDSHSASLQHFDLMIIGSRLDDMSGLDLARSLAAHPRGATDVPQWFALGWVGEDESVIEACRKVGLSARLMKPVRRSALYNCLLNVTGQAPLAAVSDRKRTARLEPIGARVLLAEDHQVNQAVFSRMLDVIGCETTLAHDGQLALNELERQDFDIVLMDCDMPQMDGFEATAALRQREAQSGAKRVAVIALTANALPGDRERCLAAGMDDYLTKPVDTQRLHEVIMRWTLDAHYQHQEPEDEHDDSSAAGTLTPAAEATPVLDACYQHQEPEGKHDDSSAADTLAPAAESTAVLDATVTCALQQMDPDGADGFFAELSARYAANSDRDLTILREALAGGELEVSRKIAHRLKSASASLGASKVAAVCSRIESAAAQGAADSAVAAVGELEREHRRAIDALQALTLDDDSAANCREVA